MAPEAIPALEWHSAPALVPTVLGASSAMWISRIVLGRGSSPSLVLGLLGRTRFTTRDRLAWLAERIPATAVARPAAIQPRTGTCLVARIALPASTTPETTVPLSKPGPSAQRRPLIRPLPTAHSWRCSDGRASFDSCTPLSFLATAWTRSPFLRSARHAHNAAQRADRTADKTQQAEDSAEQRAAAATNAGREERPLFRAFCRCLTRQRGACSYALSRSEPTATGRDEASGLHWVGHSSLVYLLCAAVVCSLLAARWLHCNRCSAAIWCAPQPLLAPEPRWPPAVARSSTTQRMKRRSP